MLHKGNTHLTPHETGILMSPLFETLVNITLHSISSMMACKKQCVLRLLSGFFLWSRACLLIRDKFLVLGRDPFEWETSSSA